MLSKYFCLIHVIKIKWYPYSLIIGRFLSFFLYLSDNEEGKTEFPYQNITTDCVKGSMVIFPPMWPWFHRGTKPIKVPKYFLGSYLTYVD